MDSGSKITTRLDQLAGKLKENSTQTEELQRQSVGSQAKFAPKKKPVDAKESQTEDYKVQQEDEETQTPIKRKKPKSDKDVQTEVQVREDEEIQTEEGKGPTIEAGVQARVRIKTFEKSAQAVIIPENSSDYVQTDIFMHVLTNTATQTRKVRVKETEKTPGGPEHERDAAAQTETMQFSIGIQVPEDPKKKRKSTGIETETKLLSVADRPRSQSAGELESTKDEGLWLKVRSGARRQHDNQHEITSTF